LPIGVEGGLAGAIRADGFVMVPDTSEGYLAGSRVRVHLYHSRQTETALKS
jgi:molybdopterin biosynthesis enzyme